MAVQWHTDDREFISVPLNWVRCTSRNLTSLPILYLCSGKLTPSVCMHCDKVKKTLQIINTKALCASNASAAPCARAAEAFLAQSERSPWHKGSQPSENSHPCISKPYIQFAAKIERSSEIFSMSQTFFSGPRTSGRRLKHPRDGLRG